MKIKLTLRYVFSIAIVAVIVVIINILILLLLLFNQNRSSISDINTDYDIAGFVRNFEKYIDIDEKNQLYLHDTGKNLIDKENFWIQILDENSTEVYSYNKPETIKNKHTPIELINGYKYAGGMGDSSQILAGYKKMDNTTYTYLIGFPMKSIQKYIFITKTDTMIKYIKYSMLLILVVDFLVAIIIGYIFSKGLTRPIKRIIGAVDDLHDGEYEVYYMEKGLYAHVFKNLNSLSNKLKENEIERNKIDNMREEWIANISHDIKTPLSSIKGYAAFLKEDDYEFSGEDVKNYAKIINDKADYIKELVDDLNLNMKLKNSESILKKDKVNIVSIVKNTVIDILNDSKYSEVDIKFECSEEKILIDIDTILIKRVLNNMIYNALVHNDNNISIVVSIYKKDKTHILINDNGKGISKTDLDNIFNRYYRGTNTGLAHKGSGLGMSIAKEIVKAHDGEIIIKSGLGEGTEVEIIL